MVYRARHLKLKRQVALKMVLAGEFAGPHARQRFQREAETAAALQHPNIVALHEAGECDGVPYLTMDLVEGRPLSDMIRAHPLPPRQAARYLLAVAEAVHYAHSHGVLHRDLKPSNVLIDGFDSPRVTDFGLAHPLDGQGTLTRSRQLLGTPSHMAPEQVSSGVDRLGPPADVYGLGALLYHLITGRPPFQGETLPSVLLQVQVSDPIAPRRLNPSLPADLETICLKCLEKAPAGRYRSAQEVARELGRFLRDEPIHARPLPALSRLARVCRRRPAVTALSASVLLLLLVVAVGSTVAAWRLRAAREAESRERRQAEAANRELRWTTGLLEMRQAEAALAAGDAASGVARLAEMLRRDPSHRLAASRLVSALTDRSWALPMARPLSHPGGVERVSFSPDGRHVLTASVDGTVRIWDAVAGVAIAAIRHEARVTCALYSHDGRRILSASADGLARISDAEDGLPLVPPLRHVGPVNDAQFSLGDTEIVTASSDKLVRLWTARTGRVRLEIPHERAVLQARLNTRATRLATGTESGTMAIYDVATGARRARQEAHRGRITSLAFSPDDQWLVSAAEDGVVRLWNPATGEPLGAPLLREKTTAPVWTTAFSPGSNLLLATTEEGRGWLWDVATQRPIGTGYAHGAGIRFGTFSPDGQRVITASADHTVRLWELATGQPFCQPLRMDGPVLHAAASQDGRRLVTASSDRTAQIWDIAPRSRTPLQLHHRGAITSLTFSRDDRSLLTTSLDRTARCWEARTGQPMGDPAMHQAPVASGDLSAEGERFLTACADGTATVWERNTLRVIAGPVRHAQAVRTARFSPDGTRFVTASADGTARVWQASNGRPLTPPLPHSGEVLIASFSLDGAWVVTASADASARVWSATSGEPVTGRLMHRDQVHWADVSPDGSKVVTASRDDSAGLWEVATGQLRARLQHLRTVEKAVFSPDGRRVLTGSLDRTAQIWDVETGQAVTPALEHDSPVSQVCFSPDSKRVLTGTWNGRVRVWDSDSGEPLTERLLLDGFVQSLCFDRQGRRIAAGSLDGHARVWEAPPVPESVPGWFPAFAEAVAGIRWTGRGHVERVPRLEGDDLFRTLETREPVEFYARLARWFLAHPEQRAASPFP